VVLATEYSRVSKRLVKPWLVRVSRVVHVVPSAEPCSCQFFGSRPGASLAEASAYATTLVGWASL